MSVLLGRFRPYASILVLLVVVVTVPLLASDTRTRRLASNTALLAGAVATLSVLCGAPLAFLLSRTDIAGRRFAAIVLLALLFLPIYLQAAAWQAGFGVQGWFTLATGAPPMVRGWQGAIAIHTLAAIPWVVLIVAVGLRLTEGELEEEALLDGTPGQVFRRVTLRRAAETIAVAFFWVAIATAGEMAVTDLFQIRTYAEEIYTQFALGDVQGPTTWRFVPTVIAAAWTVGLTLLVVGRILQPARHPTQSGATTFRLRRWRWATSALAVGTVALLVAVPATNLAVQAGRVVTRAGDGFVRSWSAERCLAMVAGSPIRFAAEFGWTVLTGTLAATAAVAVGLPLAWSARRGGWHAAPAWSIVAVVLAMPGPLVGLGLIAVFNTPELPWLVWLYDHSIAPIWAAQTIRALPLATLVLWFALRTVPNEVLASATLDGATPLVRFFRIVVPQRRAAIAAAWIAAFAVAASELDASILVVPPGVNTLPIQIFGLIHYGVDDQVAGVSLLVMSLFLVIGAVLALLARRAARATQPSE